MSGKTNDRERKSNSPQARWRIKTKRQLAHTYFSVFLFLLTQTSTHVAVKLSGFESFSDLRCLKCCHADDHWGARTASPTLWIQPLFCARLRLVAFMITQSSGNMKVIKHQTLVRLHLKKIIKKSEFTLLNAHKSLEGPVVFEMPEDAIKWAKCCSCVGRKHFQ